ncbi:uncharacterized protein BDR25DRAFT_305449 [Lindgomyces ingoldianus]|uniref:Uncharacterized protein n=1 Tax=Lindgomyces ingoldianus TaxID=673940 RepID=A0ACB6QL85_9PLEO|nr:uncharacterized protein BDR25DRAFT_305449 [Lindgomyces ingoldianus]KAF2467703.1 hypothetical protein BDR25DRAFT_305449 [Lindgomyces ingoldianus]
MVPAATPRINGPYNRKRAEALYTLFNTHEATANRMMLVDKELEQWLTKTQHDGRNPWIYAPLALRKEVEAYGRGYPTGPAMKQESNYNALAIQNNSSKSLVTIDELDSILKEFDGAEHGEKICYCQRASVKQEGMNEVVDCGYKDCKIGKFHRKCVSEWFPEKFTRWYCAACLEEMEVVVDRLMEELDGKYY